MFINLTTTAGDIKQQHHLVKKVILCWFHLSTHQILSFDDKYLEDDRPLILTYGVTEESVIDVLDNWIESNV